MKYISHYNSPLGRIIIESDGKSLTGLWFEEQQRYACKLEKDAKERKLPIFDVVTYWLDCYFGGKNPNFTPGINVEGTDFRKKVWSILMEIPYGKCVTYSEIADKVALKMGIAKMSAQAVGGAVGSNPISLIIPCHRVIGKNGSLTGYAGGLERKAELLKLERGEE